jgi:triacylglycerol lipase
VAAQGEDVVVAFRGTHEDREWIEALAYGQAPWGCGRAHKGCTRLVDNIWTNLLAALYDEDANARRLWLTGHSIGGTLALVAASKLEHEGFDVYNVTTFGSPAVLDRRAAESFRCNVYRVVNNEDVVADLPWPTLLDSYVHAGERILLTASGRVAAPHHSDELARRIDRANALGEGIHPSGAFYDHSMESYLAKLKALGTNESRESTEP